MFSIFIPSRVRFASLIIDNVRVCTMYVLACDGEPFGGEMVKPGVLIVCNAFTTRFFIHCLKTHVLARGGKTDDWDKSKYVEYAARVWGLRPAVSRRTKQIEKRRLHQQLAHQTHLDHVSTVHAAMSITML